MNEAMRTHNPRTRVAMALIAVLLLLLVALAFALQPAATTSDRSPAVHATSAAGGSSVDYDPYIERHAEVVAAYQGAPR